MPAYQFFALSEGRKDAAPLEFILYNDTAAMRRAISEAFPEGCDVWQAHRFVGSFHRARVTAAEDSRDPVPLAIST